MNLASKKLIASTWAQRAQAELGAEKKFKELIKRFIAYDIDKKIISLAVSAAKDEKRHSQMCFDVAKKFGHSTGFELVNLNNQNKKKAWLLERTKREILVIDVVLMCCITETANASLLNTIYASSKNTEIGKIINEILKDEVKHGQMGWAFLAAEVVKNNCEYISKYLPQMLENSINDELFLPHLKHDNILSSIVKDGVLPFHLRVEQFKETFDSVIVPGFKKFNIDTSSAQAWFNKKQRAHELHPKSLKHSTKEKCKS